MKYTIKENQFGIMKHITTLENQLDGITGARYRHRKHLKNLITQL